MTDGDLPFLTVVAFADTMSAGDAVDLVAGATGIGAPEVRHRLAKMPPLVVGALRGKAATTAVEVLRAEGCDAFTNTLADLAALGPTLKIRDLRLTDRGIDVDLWRGLSTTIRREDVRLLVRATVHTKKQKTVPLPPIRPTPGPGQAGRILRAAFDARPQERPETVASEKLDIHTSDGSVYQIDGDKFGYTILGDLRGHGDRANMDSMCELLGHVTPDEILDEYFGLWSPPPGHESLRVPEMKINGDDPAFAFYSRWAALLYRHLAGDW